MSRIAIAGILRDLGRRPRRRLTDRQIYAATFGHVRQAEMPFAVNKMHRLGGAEIPPNARITPEDMDLARAEKNLPAPRSDDEVEHYKAALYQSPLYRNVLNKLKEFSAFSPGGDTMHWSIGQFTGDNPIMAIPPRQPYEQTHHELFPLLPAARQRIHERALEASLNPLARARPGRDKNFAMVIGPPGAGKSTVGVPYAHTITHNYTTIDVDKMRSHLPEYEGWNSKPVHMESSYLTYGSLLPHALEQNHHLIYDATGSNHSMMEKTLQMARNHGYTNHLILVHRPAFQSMASAWGRFLANPYGAKIPNKEPSRFIDPVWAYRNIGNNPKLTYDYLTDPKNTHLLNTYTMLDPDTPKGEEPRILEHGRVRR